MDVSYESGKYEEKRCAEEEVEWGDYGRLAKARRRNTRRGTLLCVPAWRANTPLIGPNVIFDDRDMHGDVTGRNRATMPGDEEEQEEEEEELQGGN
ncbi:unnamed protein product [Heligmosomoides polygyrus]|uniref:Uncharacterized protein n=1 Tax=Heligmosomoides polygyrus TaxID=6339 RepID=A0A183FN77_HELPZ|nr:unnamed protein product [Heligmosomoides polygyrus]